MNIVKTTHKQIDEMMSELAENVGIRMLVSKVGADKTCVFATMSNTYRDFAIKRIKDKLTFEKIKFTIVDHYEVVIKHVMI